MRALLTDLYQLTMAAGYWRQGLAEREACFALFFRRCPFGGGYAVTCGFEGVREYLEGFSFSAEDCEYLASLRDAEAKPLFSGEFLAYLGELRLRVDVAAMPEGTVAFPYEPLLRVTGPLLQCQLLETGLLNLMNFPTLVATKAARICGAAGDGAVLEFGLRRAQGPDGGLTASRAAYVGGCAGTSNVLAGQRYGIPVKGTHAHSWVLAYPSEREAFGAYAESFPGNSLLLVDTYDVGAGLDAAVETAKGLAAAGHRLLGVRIDSGDLRELSILARNRLDSAGLTDAVVVASGDLDEHRVADLRASGATIDVWGVGTRLAAAYDDAALTGVYKLTAVRDEHGVWQRRNKRSAGAQKGSLPGLLTAGRVWRGGEAAGDWIFDLELGLDVAVEVLVRTVMRGGAWVAESEGLQAVRERVRRELRALPEGVKRLRVPEEYPVVVEERLGGMVG